MMASGFGTDVETFERQRILDIQEKAINNLSGGGNGLLGAVLAMGMVNSMNSGGRRDNQLQQQQTTPPQQQVNPNAHMVYCGNCGRKYDVSTSRFCPNCGKQYYPCPKCGSDNLNHSRRCVNCGSPLQTASVATSFCPRCGAEVPNDSNFCPKCGNKVK